MNFKKKLKIRLYCGIGFTLLGIAIIVISNLIRPTNDLLSTFGLCVAVVGIARIRHYFLITKNEESIQKQEIAESDERNVYLSNKARSIAFYIYVLAVSLAVIVFHILGKTEIAVLLSYTVCLLIAIYWLAYFIIRKKS